jgi:hypothetical protein
MVQLRILVPQLLEIVAYTRIIVDGIDECSKDSQKTILKELQAVCSGPTSHCKVLFSSRKEVHIRERLSKQPQISLDGRQEVDLDIRSLVKYKMTKLPTSNQELLDKIESTLVAKADGDKAQSPLFTVILIMCRHVLVGPIGCRRAQILLQRLRTGKINHKPTKGP